MTATSASPADSQFPPLPDEPTLEILPSRGWININFAEIWRYRELAYYFVWRDIKVRYKQTVLGATWAIIQPLLTMVVFSIIFGALAKIPSDGIPYPIFSFAALVPWTYFTAGLSSSSNSLVGNSSLINKIYFPRLLIPISSILVGIPDFLLAFATLLVLMSLYAIQAPTIAMTQYFNNGFVITLHNAFNLSINWSGLLLLPVLFLIANVAALGTGLWLATLNAQYRDVRYVVPFIVQFWFYITPIAYSSQLLGPQWRFLYSLNPMAGVVDGFRWALLGSGSPPTLTFALSSFAAFVLLITGALYFRRQEAILSDVL